MEPRVSQYVIGVVVPPVRISRPRTFVYGFSFCFLSYSGLIWLANLWLSHPEHPPALIARGLLFALFMSLMSLINISATEGGELVLVVTDEYIERKTLSSAGTTLATRKLYRTRVRNVSEIRRRLRPFPFRRRKGLMIEGCWLGRHIFVPETAPDYAAIKAKLLDWASMRVA